MSELDDAIAAITPAQASPVYLLAGEEFLIRQGAEKLLEALVPKDSHGLNVVTLDGASPKDVAVELDTMAMFGGRKVVLCRDPEFLAPKKGRPDALAKAVDAWRANRRKEAARRVLTIVARAGWGAEALDVGAKGGVKVADWDKELGITLEKVDVAFLKELKAYCDAEGLRSLSNDESALVEWLKRGPMDGQVLVLAVTELDAKAPFVKAVKDQGTYLDFKVAGRLKDLDITDFVAQTLSPLGKKLGAGAVDVLKERVGSNFRLLQSELTKLALHADGATITAQDVAALVGHAREDEYFELSEAVQKRDFEGAMKYLADAVAQGSHPIMLLGSIAGIVRTMLMSFERMVALSDGKPPKSYPDFQARIWPKVEAEARANKGKVPHPYAVFMGMQAAKGYGRQELLGALKACAEADLALKLGGDVLVLERLVWTLCGKAGPWESTMHVIRREQER